MKFRFGMDRIFRVPRSWSNEELRKFAPLFTGDVVNASGWKDSDKEGSVYRDYFRNAEDYHISNFTTDAHGWQGDLENEFFLDLEKPLKKSLSRRYDVVFNHTTLEHVFEAQTAFRNLCEMSKDIVIIVVPFVQQMHTAYGDYWRFTPQCIKRLFEKNGMQLVYLSYNDDKRASVYVFAIGTRNPKKWKHIRKPFSYESKGGFLQRTDRYTGARAITNPLYVQAMKGLRLIFRRGRGDSP